jgi:hypothetical protein
MKPTSSSPVRLVIIFGHPHIPTVIPTGEPHLLRLAVEGSLFDLNVSSNFRNECRP